MDAHRGLPLPQRYWAILVIGLSTALSVIDTSIANIALPTIAHDLKISSATSILVINAYQVAVTMTMLPLAALGDIVGYRRISQLGMGVFVAASAACFFADSLWLLVLARLFQGFGAAGIMCMSSALVRETYPSEHLGRGIGINSMVVASSSALGPSLGGAMLSVVSWPWLFAINIPIGLLALWIGWRNLPVSRVVKKPYDVRSAVMNVLTFGLFSIGINGISHGQSSPLVAFELVAALVIGLIFVRRQLTQETPLLPVDLLRKPLLALSFTTSLCCFVGQALLLITLPFYFQQVIGLSPGQTGLVMTPWPLTVALMAPLAGYLADRYPAGLLGCVGLVIAATGIVTLGLLSPHSLGPDIVWRMALCGFGFGLFQTPNTRIIIHSSPRERSGSVGGMIGTVRLTGQTIGAALAALVFNMFADQSGKFFSLYCAAGIVLVAAAFSVARFPLVREDH